MNAHALGSLSSSFDFESKETTMYSSSAKYALSSSPISDALTAEDNAFFYTMEDSMQPDLAKSILNVDAAKTEVTPRKAKQETYVSQSFATPCCNTRVESAILQQGDGTDRHGTNHSCHQIVPMAAHQASPYHTPGRSWSATPTRRSPGRPLSAATRHARIMERRISVSSSLHTMVCHEKSDVAVLVTPSPDSTADGSKAQYPANESFLIASLLRKRAHGDFGGVHDSAKPSWHVSGQELGNQESRLHDHFPFRSNFEELISNASKSDQSVVEKMTIESDSYEYSPDTRLYAGGISRKRSRRRYLATWCCGEPLMCMEVL